MLNRIIQLFPLWAVLASVVAYFVPSLFLPLKSYIVPLLMMIMLAMGLTLTFADFKTVISHKAAVMVGIILQFSVMPIAALLISFLFQFDADLTVGMVLVGSVAGGTSSNVMCYLAKGNVALSISMTALSTLIGVVMTPLLSELLAGKSVDVPVMGMLMSLVKIVFIPVAIGILINQFIPKFTQSISSFLPLISMVSILLIIAIVIALNKEKITSVGPIVALAVILHNSIGLFLGYWICRLIGFKEDICRTISFEVGLQNSGLATALAMNFFSPAAAIPGSLFSLWHNFSGSILAGLWAKKEIKDK